VQAELDRLDLLHAMTYILDDGKLHLAPSHNPHRVLDIGASSGICNIDFADIYPSAEILGVDLSANPPTYVPPNVRFEVDDLEDDWTFTYPFDYVHSRYMAGSIKDWPRLMKQCASSEFLLWY
jgi:trans-aconitate methyltransferase